MAFDLFLIGANALLLLLLAFFPICNFIQNPKDFAPLKLQQSTRKASLDFGRLVFNSPSAVLRPDSPKDISLLLRSISYSSCPSKRLSVATRGAGHSINGQAQALHGIVIEMDALPSAIKVHKNKEGESGFSYADVSGGALWIELLEESLKEGLAPSSWTDYLYLSIGGTLSNAGISGQSFKHGPQISNVIQLDVVTGMGELVTCSPTFNSELFHAVLGGLGQFGIITSARIMLQDAPLKVRWVRAIYDDFNKFTKDQELLVSMPEKVDYVEGFMVLNEKSLHASFIAFPTNLDPIPQLRRDGKSKILYCIEFVVHVHHDKDYDIEQVVKEVTREMSHMPSLLYSVQVSYYDFLNRVRLEEVNLKERSMWEVPHPWLNMLVPKSAIIDFKDLLMENISIDDFEGPILIYPLLRDKWDMNMSAVLPENGAAELIVYVIGVLPSANPATCSTKCLHDLLQHRRRIACTATGPHIGAKQYLAHHPTQVDWQNHFGQRWDRFEARKARFDPLRILSPGQGIFPRASTPLVSY